MEHRFVNRDDVFKYLDNTFCFFDGKPVYVTCPDNLSKSSVRIEHTDEKVETIEYSNPLFTFSEARLGYSNLEEKFGTVYVSKTPVRQQKFGVCPRNLNFKVLSTKDDGYIRDYKKVVFKVLSNCNFTPYEEALAAVLSKKAVSRAVSRDLCIARPDKGKNRIVLLHHETEIALYVKGQWVIIDNGNYSFIRDKLKRNGINA